MEKADLYMMSKVSIWILLALIVGWLVFVFFQSFKRSTILALSGIGTVFLALPLAGLFSSLTMSSSVPVEVVESWLFFFRFLGIGLFLWGMCDSLGQRIADLTHAVNSKNEAEKLKEKESALF